MRNLRTQLLCSLLALPLLATSIVAFAQSSPVGRWKTYDEETGKPRLIVDIYQAKNGAYAAKVVETLFAANATCTSCSGANKDKPIKDMVILWNLKPDGENAFSGGTVLKLSNGKTYKSKAELTDGGEKINVYGCLGFICKHQTWTREH